MYQIGTKCKSCDFVYGITKPVKQMKFSQGYCLGCYAKKYRTSKDKNSHRSPFENLSSIQLNDSFNTLSFDESFMNLSSDQAL